jgi:hypothetical protein
MGARLARRGSPGLSRSGELLPGSAFKRHCFRPVAARLTQSDIADPKSTGRHDPTWVLDWIAAKWEEILLFQRLTKCPHQGPTTGCEVYEQPQRSQTAFGSVKPRLRARLVTTSLVTSSSMVSLTQLVSHERIRPSPHQPCNSSCLNAWICMEIQAFACRVRIPEPSNSRRKITKVTLSFRNRGTKNDGYFSMIISSPELYRSCTFVARCRSSR